MTDIDRYITHEAVTAGEDMAHAILGGRGVSSEGIRKILAAALPHIAPLVRADERGRVQARVQAEVEKRDRAFNGVIGGLVEAIDRVRALHYRWGEPIVSDRCAHCGTPGYPCPTIRALDGDE